MTRVLLLALGVAVAVMVAAACSDDPVPSAPPVSEAGTSSGEAAAPDAKPPSMFEGCRAGTFGAPEPITSLNSDGVELSLRLAEDELTGIITGGNDDLYTVRRADGSDSFAAPLSLGAVINTAASSETHAMLNADGTTLYFDSDRAGGKGGRDIYTSTRGDGGVFAAPIALAAVNEADDDGHLYLVGGANLYFASNRGGAGAHIFLAKNFTGTAQVELASVAEKEDDFPVVTTDERELFFASSRGGKGLRSIWVADRASSEAPFSAPRLVAELDSDGDDRPTWISADGCRLYLVSDRAGTFDVYVSTRQ